MTIALNRIGRTFTMACTALVLSSSLGFAQDVTPAKSVARPPQVGQKQLRDEILGVQPQVGLANYRNANGDPESRAVYGALFDLNLAGIMNNVGTWGGISTQLFLGPQVGFLYSHIGTTDASFFGSSSSNITPGAPGGSNMLIVPTDLKLGWAFGDFRISAHGGGNVIYRSVASAVTVGINPNTSGGSDTSIFPNAGADLEWGRPGGIGLSARGDWTISGQNRIYSGTLGALIPLA